MALESVTVRIGALRSHSQALTLKLTKDIPLDEIEDLLANDNDWVKFIPNTKEASMQQLTPVAATGTMDIPVGSVRTLAMGQEYSSSLLVGYPIQSGHAVSSLRMLAIYD